MFSWSREELHLLGGCFLGQERNCIYLQEAAVCISSLIQTGIVTIQSWTSVTEVNLSPLTPRQDFCVVFPDQMLWCPKLSAPYEPQILTSFYPHCLSTALSASYSLDFFLLLAKKKKGHLGKRGHKCWLAFLYFIPLPDLCPKIFHCSVNSRSFKYLSCCLHF